MPSTSSTMRRRFAVWLVCVLCAGGFCGWQLLHGVPIDTNLLSLLPPTEQDLVIERAVRKFTEHVGQKTVFLFGHTSKAKARQAGEIFLGELAKSGHFKKPLFRITQTTQQAYWKLYFPYRWQLLSSKSRQRLRQASGPQAHLKDVLQTLYGPMSSAVSPIIARDPLLLFPGYLQGMPKMKGSLRMDGDVLVARDGKHTYVFAAIESTKSVFSRSAQRTIGQAIARAKVALRASMPKATLHSTGAIYFAQAGGRSAEREISTIGLGSAIGLLLLLLMTFRSARQLLLGGLPLAVGFLLAWVVCVAWFGRIHMLTLVFGASLIGVCIDYAFHYFSEQRMAPSGWTPDQGIKHILPGVTLGVITSIIGYLGLLIAPFPGLQQMALFSSVGLLGAYATVLCAFPLLSGPHKERTTPALLPTLARLPVRWQSLSTRTTIAVLGVLALLCVPGLLQLRANDDIRQLYYAPPALIAQDDLVKKRIGSIDSSRFFLVEGKTPEATLQRVETLRKRLLAPLQQGIISHIQAITDVLPSLRRQRADHALLRRVFGTTGALRRHMETLGFKKTAIQQAIRALKGKDRPGLTPKRWLTHPASEAMRHLWLGRTERGFASFVLLSGVTKEGPLQRLETPKQGIHYIDKVRDISTLFKRYRALATKLIVLAYLVIFLLLLVRYGWRRGLRVFAPPCLAALAALSVVGWLGGGINLFHILALLLVLGIGIDYTIFFAESSERWQPTYLAIVLSACTTLLSFGLLALSQTPLLRAFGSVVLVGMCIACILAPIAIVERQPQQSASSHEREREHHVQAD